MRAFISYSHADLARAVQIADRCRASGLEVFIDERLRSGDGFRDDLEREVRAADAVIVLWTKSSVTSSWVREEAELARRLRTYRPVSFGVEPPFGFREVHTPKLGLTATASDVLAALDLATVTTPAPEPAPTAPQPDFDWHDRPTAVGRLTRWLTKPR